MQHNRLHCLFSAVYSVQGYKKDISDIQTVKKLDFILFSRARKGLGNEAFPNWNPQSEFISDEEKPKFQGF
mgnify:FL=1